MKSSIQSLEEDFRTPPLSCRPTALLFLNDGILSKERLRACVDMAARCGYAGVLPLPSFGMEPGYMTKEYLNLYRDMVEYAAGRGMIMGIYDEFSFPSGSAGGFVEKHHPESVMKKLLKQEQEVTGPLPDFSLSLPEGKLMAAVAVNPDDPMERQDIAGDIRGGRLCWAVPAGRYKIILCYLVTTDTQGTWRVGNYLSETAMRQFLQYGYQPYYDTMPDYFGSTLQYGFFDEPGYWYTDVNFDVPSGREWEYNNNSLWTDDFNETFEKRFGYSPVLSYPALYEDIGEDTPSLRYDLSLHRAELFEHAFFRTIGEWNVKKGLKWGGHMLGDNGRDGYNPISYGDIFKNLSHAAIPMSDNVFSYNLHYDCYKFVSSIAFNYDKPFAGIENLAGIPQKPSDLYRETMEPYSLGINTTVLHAMWYNAQAAYEGKDKTILPVLDADDPTFGEELPRFSAYISRLNHLLQGGRHVADIGILFPIDDQHATNHFKREVQPADMEYIRIANHLCSRIRRDCTIVHPEVLDACTTQNGQLVMDNAVNRESFSLFILPPLHTIKLSNLESIHRFFQAGGTVISVGAVPMRAVVSSEDTAVVQLYRDMFKDAPAQGFSKNTSPSGGRAFAIADRSQLEAVLADTNDTPDVRFLEVRLPQESRFHFHCIHKIKDGCDIYFFANATDEIVDTDVWLRGTLTPRLWDPHTGRTADINFHAEKGVTRLHLHLEPISSVFLVSGGSLGNEKIYA